MDTSVQANSKTQSRCVDGHANLGGQHACTDFSSNGKHSVRILKDDLEPEAWSGNRNRKLWKQTCIRAALSVSPHTYYPHPKTNPNPTHYPLAIPLQPRTSLDIHCTLTINHRHPQICMSDVGRPPMDRHQRHLRRKSEQRARLPRLEQISGKAVKKRWRSTMSLPWTCGTLLSSAYLRRKTGKGVYRSLESLKAMAIVDGCVAFLIIFPTHVFFYINTDHLEKTGHQQTTPSTHRNCTL